MPLPNSGDLIMSNRSAIPCYINGTLYGSVKGGLRAEGINDTTSSTRTMIRGVLRDGMSVKIYGAVIVPVSQVIDLRPGRNND